MKLKLCVKIILLVGIGVCSCNMKKSGESLTNTITKIELTERQKDILENEGPSTNVDELSVSQKNAIVAIEEMLSYLEDKYAKSFEYVGYIPTGNLEKETLRARASDGFSLTDSFEVRRMEEGFEDDYMLVAIRDGYANYVEKLLITNCGVSSIKVYADIYTTELEEIPDDGKRYNNNVSAWKVIFIYITEDKREEATSYLEIIEQVLRDNNLGYDSRVVFLKEDIILEITKFNYMDYVSDDYYWEQRTIRIE